MSDLSIAVSGPPEDVVVRPVGEVDVATAPHLLAELDVVAAAGARRVTVDLSGVSFIDSSGLGALVEALKRQRASGGDVVLKAPGASTRRVIEITGLDQVFTVL